MQVIIFILLTSIAISTTAIESNLSRTCIPSRCGNQEIRYPYNCGDQNYQLSCIGNKTFLEAPYDKYLVTNIFYDNYTTNIVDTDLASGKCNLPSQAITPRSFPNGYTAIDHFDWTGFINCSEKLEIIDRIYEIIPCLSQNNRFIYDIENPRIEDLPTSCTYMTMVPIQRDVDVLVTGDDIFGILKQGFSVSWAIEKHTRFTLIRGCLSEALLPTWISLLLPNNLIPIEYGFLDCIADTHDFTLYIYSVVSTVFFDIVLFYLVSTIFIRLIIAPLCVHAFLLFELKKLLSPIDSIETFLRNQDGATPTRYAYSDIVAMTSHFKDRLGQGGFGTVYKGELPGGYLIAIKLLGKSNDSGEDFISEVSTIGMIHHTNIVRLVGFCSEGLHRALVYEFMYNGSLDKYIFSSTQKFSTKKLHEIALGVARGIDYLHRGCDMRILHFDIKPHNILLDSNFNPKVSDFGLAKLYPKDKSLVSAFAGRGTIGYMAPELISRCFGIISYKSDVYSFGMLLLEMVGGRRHYFPSWIYDRLDQRRHSEVLEHEVEIEDMERKLCKVGLWCIQTAPSARPSMIKVMEMLEGDVDDLEMPPKPLFFSSSQSNTREQNSLELSSNEISTIYESE